MLAALIVWMSRTVSVRAASATRGDLRRSRAPSSRRFRGRKFAERSARVKADVDMRR